MAYHDDRPEPPGAIDDDRLRLIFTCCHPALAMQTRVALTLRMVGGLTVPEIARAHLVAEPPSIDKGEVTDKGSINQRSVLKHRAAVADALHAGTLPFTRQPR